MAGVNQTSSKLSSAHIVTFGNVLIDRSLNLTGTLRLVKHKEVSYFLVLFESKFTLVLNNVCWEKGRAHIRTVDFHFEDGGNSFRGYLKKEDKVFLHGFIMNGDEEAFKIGRIEADSSV